MSTKQCQACREMIDAQATICPKCRSKQKGKSSLGVLLGAGVAVLLGLMWLGGDPEDAPSSKSSTQFENGFQSTAADFAKEQAEKNAVTAPELAALLADNEVAMLQKYQGRPLIVTGIVIAVNSVKAGRTMIQMSGGPGRLAVVARMEAEYSGYVAGLRRGDSAKVLCADIGTGVGTVMVSTCEPA